MMFDNGDGIGNGFWNAPGMFKETSTTLYTEPTVYVWLKPVFE